MKSKLTEFRKEMLDTIRESEKPLNAKTVLNRMDSVPNLSTVYRALDFLVKSGLVNTVSLGRVTFYYKQPDHEGGHFIFCGHCNEIQAFQDCIAHQIKERIQSEFDYRITHHVLCFEGLCADCRKSLDKKQRMAS